MTTATIYGQQNQLLATRTIADSGPTVVLGSWGVHPFRGLLRCSNGYMTPLAGDLYYSRIVIDLDVDVQIVERLHVRQTGPRQVTIGGTPGGDLWPVQASLRIRHAKPGMDALDKLPLVPHATVGHVTIPFSRALKGQYAYGRTWAQNLRNGTTGGDNGWMQTGALGPFQPGGNNQAGPGGFTDIEIAYGREFDSATALLKHDLCWDRMPIDCLDPETGNPAPNPVLGSHGYVLERGAKVQSHLPCFWIAAPTSDDADRAVARKGNLGACAYEGALRAYQAHNGQHWSRAFSPGLAAWRVFGDACAEFDLQMLAADARYAHPAASDAVPGQGSTFYGRREPSWVSMLWSELGQRNPIGPETVKCQTKADAFMCVPSVPNPSFVPNPWLPDNPNDNIPDPLPADRSVEQTQERFAATVHAMVAMGNVRAAIRACTSQFLDPDSVSRRRGYVPRFFATGLPSGAVGRITEACGPPDFAPMLAFGTMCFADPANRTLWLDAACYLLAPYMPQGHTAIIGGHPNHAALYNAFKYHQDVRGQIGGVLAALEEE